MSEAEGINFIVFHKKIGNRTFCSAGVREIKIAGLRCNKDNEYEECQMRWKLQTPFLLRTNTRWSVHSFLFSTRQCGLPIRRSRHCSWAVECELSKVISVKSDGEQEGLDEVVKRLLHNSARRARRWPVESRFLGQSLFLRARLCIKTRNKIKNEYR